LAELDVAVSLDSTDARAHNNRGSALQLLGRFGEAENAFRRALELAPHLSPPHVNLGNLYQLQGRYEMAIAVYELAIEHGLDAAMFSQYVAAVKGNVTSRSPDTWVRATFDNFAPTFDAHLSVLSYKVPQHLAGILSPHVDGPIDILDLGCGTGQCGMALRQHSRYMVGLDLSPQMLARARAHGIYDELHESEVHDWLKAADAATFDLVIAADVLIYIGAIEELFIAVSRVLRSGGHFAFSTEEESNADYTLLQTGRYAQSEAYIRRLALANFSVVIAEPTFIRQEADVPLAGRLYLLRRK
jgi:predicted TPR repeat methyltransferase